ncbi:YfmQ family protein [Paenibacillus silviterrae]|uniref:YfmQ family protein n=1 Tax=Paenibacillus silviterrae TaxID=3242194 RepID=UPI002542F9B3|nr:YfmQ family protein [Paenibacillus chinjuensis]
MTWALIISTILVCFIKILITCLPTASVEWLVSKFQVHIKLNAETVTVSYRGRNVEGDEKARIVHLLNEAVFMEKHYIWPGTEQLHLNPENKGFPVILETKLGKNEVTLYAFINNRDIYIARQYKNKVIAYSLVSEHLHKHLNTQEGLI